MSIPDFQTLMRPLLEMVGSSSAPVQNATLLHNLELHFGLTRAERGRNMPGGTQTVFGNRFNWARTYLLRAGLLRQAGRGVNEITGEGRSLLERCPDRITIDDLRVYASFVEFVTPRRGNGGQTGDDGDCDGEYARKTPDEILRDAHRQIFRTLQQELLQRIIASSPSFFEMIVVRLLGAMGYGGGRLPGRVLGRCGDDGVDGVVDQDPLGLDRVYIQAKRYGADNKVGADSLRNFAGSLDLHRANKGLFVTTSDFTENAKKTVELLSRRIILINGVGLTELMLEADVAVRPVETLTLKRLDEDFFAEAF